MQVFRIGKDVDHRQSVAGDVDLQAVLADQDG